MKSKLILLALLLPLLATAQQTEGEILFKETIQLDLDLPEEDAAMRAMMPSSQSFTRSLLFDESASLYRDYDAADEEDFEFRGTTADGGDLDIVMKVPENTRYTDLAEGTTLNSREFFGRMFLISGEQAKHPWKLTGQTKKILDYPCQQATFDDGERQVEAWFAPQVPVPAGPGEFGGLPGLILEVSIDGGQRTATAIRADLKDLADDAVEKPTKGKAVTQEEFDKIEAEKMKEMGAEGGGGRMRVMIRN